MKILHIVEAFGAGVFVYIRDLAAFQSKEHEVYVLFNGLDSNTPENYKSQFPSNVTMIRSLALNRSFNPYKVWKAVKEIQRTVHEVAPDIVHLHSAFAGFFGRLALKGGKPLVLYSPHAYSFLPLDKKMSLKKRLFFQAEKALGKRNCITVCVCKSEYEESAGITNRRVCINSGIDTDAFQHLINTARENGASIQSGNGKYAVMTGRICEQKRPDLFNEIARQMPELDFIWVGDGPLRDALTSRNIKVTGWLDRLQVIKILAKADLFLFTTEFETISIALLEAMYLELPCVASNVCGNWDVIEPDKNGYLCGDISDYCAAIREILRHPEKASKLGGQAKADVLSKFSTVAMEKAYREFFTSLEIPARDG